MSDLGIWPEIGTLLVGMAASGIGNHLQRKRERGREHAIPMKTVALTHPVPASFGGGICSMRDCETTATDIDHEGYFVCGEHAAYQRQRLVQMQAEAQYAQRPPQPQPQIRPVQPARQPQRVDPHDEETVRDRRSYRPEPRTKRDYRDEFEDDGFEDDENYLDEEEFYEEEDLCPHRLDPARCRRCIDSMQRARSQRPAQRPAPQQRPQPPQRPQQRSAQSRRPTSQDDRPVNRGVKSLPRRRRS